MCIMFNFWQYTGPRSYIIRMKNQGHFYSRIDYPRIQLNMKAFSNRNYIQEILNRTSPTEIHLIKSNLCLITRLFLFIWSNPNYVSALDYFCPFDQNPTYVSVSALGYFCPFDQIELVSQHQVIFVQLIKSNLCFSTSLFLFVFFKTQPTSQH